ncbi:Metallo-hydrolase/oxidoreductase [Calocera viscosa TUFC12733]|uniref:Metallo-hydrolase/oxidoreductase n=1 Tax=Calocera viscosa (strain TUFC12733) TaxID=1330018 RepID=A0A167Q454_CALVF|nr:Metallo-hydrolase/oxidoreductase [Calocera viscosa TUFC12733]
MASRNTAHVDPLSLVFTPIPPSTSSRAVVKLTLLNCGELISSRVMFRQRQTMAEMAEQETAVVFSWVVEKEIAGEVKRYLWDLGVVSSLDKVPKQIADAVRPRFALNVPAAAQPPFILSHLSPSPAPVETLTGLFLSHAHFDHYGCMTDFPSRLPLYVGPGTKTWVKGGDEAPGGLKGFPSAFWRHPVFVGEIGEEGAKGKGKEWTSVGTYEKAWDWFGDGSFTLLQAPGHCPGHMCALARVSTSPDTYVLLAADTCHSRYIYTPFPHPSHRHAIAHFAPVSEGPAETTPGSATMHGDVAEAYRSIARLTRMEMEENVMCVLAHETEVAQELRVGVGEMKQGWERWKENGWKIEKERGVHPQPKMV